MAYRDINHLNEGQPPPRYTPDEAQQQNIYANPGYPAQQQQQQRQQPIIVIPVSEPSNTTTIVADEHYRSHRPDDPSCLYISACFGFFIPFIGLIMMCVYGMNVVIDSNICIHLIHSTCRMWLQSTTSPSIGIQGIGCSNNCRHDTQYNCLFKRSMKNINKARVRYGQIESIYLLFEQTLFFSKNPFNYLLTKLANNEWHSASP